MSSAPRNPAAGPHGYWDPGKAPPAGTMVAIAHAACELLGIEVPETAEEAAIVLTRLRFAKSDEEVQRARASAFRRAA